MKVCLKKAGLSLFMAAAAFMWTTCDVGLGEAVDTMAPTVSITKPAQSAVCAGPVEISGTCGDDKGIASINIVVTNTGTGEKFTCQGKVTENTKWAATINQLAEGAGYPLKDGSYTADVTAVDIFGRTSGTSSAAFDIDNTAPVFCVTSPASLDITNPRKYGRSVTISGEIADDHDIAKMNVRVFRIENGATTEITSALAKTEFTDFETAGGTTVYVAKYFDQAPAANNADGSENPDYALYKNYMAIYGNFALGTDVLIYAVPTLTDVAGNASQVCYLSSEVKNLAAKLCNVEVTIDSLQTAQLMKIYNGTYTGEELNDDQKAKIISLLDGSYQLQTGEAAYYSRYDDNDEAKKSPLAASVNSDNSPKYAFSGYELESAAANVPALKWSEINTGGTLSVSVQAGLDDWGVLPSELEVCLLKCDDDGEPYNEGDANYKKFVSDQTEGFTITNALGESIKDISTSVTAQSYYVTLPKMSSNECYLLTASGKDEDGNGLTPAADKYGLKVASTGAAPKVNFDDRYFIKGSRMIAGASDAASVVLKITDATDTINDGAPNHFVDVERSLYRGHIASKGSFGNYTYKLSVTDTFTTQIEKVATNEYTLTVPLNKYTDDVLSEPDPADPSKRIPEHYTLALNVKAKNASAETDALFILWVDNKKPQIVMYAPTSGKNVFENDSNITKKLQSDKTYKYYYTPNGEWSDEEGSGTSALWYSVEDTGSAAPTISGNAADGWTIAGNVKSSSERFEWRRINAVPAEKSPWSTNWAGYDAAGNELDVKESTGNFIKMIAVDAVGNISDVVKADNITFNFNAPKVALTSEPYTSATSPATIHEYYNAAAPVDATSGKLTFVFTATHNLPLDDTAPISVTAINTVTGASDGCATSWAFAKDEESGADIPTKAIATVALDTNGNADGKWKFTVSAKDSCGQTSDAQIFETTVDRTPPQLVAYDYDPAHPGAATTKPIVIKDTGTTADWYKDETLKISAKWIEADTGSGVAKIYYWLGTPTMQQSSSYAVPEDLTTASGSGYIEIPTSANKGNGVIYNITPTGFEEIIPDGSDFKRNNLYIQAVDKAGNLSSIIGQYQINEDKHAPSLEAKYYTYDDATFSKAAGTAVSNGANAMILYGKTSDDLSAVEEITFKIGEAALTPTEIKFTTSALPAATSDTEYTTYRDADWKAYGDIAEADKTKITGWRAKMPTSNTSGSLYAKASDRAKNATSEQKLFDIAIDQDSPTIDLTTPRTNLCASAYVQGGTPQSGGDSTAVKDVNGEISVSGTASDPNLQSVSVYVGNDATAAIVSADQKLIELSDESKYNWSVQNKFSYIKKDGETGPLEFWFSDGTKYIGSGKPIYIKVRAVDSAANERINVYRYNVDPKSDRPVITLFKPLSGMTSVDANYKWFIHEKSISGSISDDDGISELTATYRLYNSASDAFADPVDATVSLDNGSFTVSGLPEGKQIISFTVKDAEGHTFAAHDSGASSYIAPIIKGSDAAEFGAAKNGDTLLYIKVDDSEPEIRNIRYSYYDKNKKDDAGAAAPGYVTPSSSLATLGGARDKLKIVFEAKDANGIKGVNFSMTDGSATPITQTISGTVGEDADEDGYVTCTIEGIQINDTKKLADGTWTAEILVEDKSKDKDDKGLVMKSTLYITVDNTPPDIEMKSPDGLQPVSGKVSAFGKVDEADVSYLMWKNDTDTETSLPATVEWKPIESSLSWNIYFDGDTTAPNHDKELKDYLIDFGMFTPGDDSAAVQSLYLWMKAVDEVGNEAVKKFEIKVDPNGDRPTVKINSPSEDGKTVGGKLRVLGEASDNEEVKAVFVQIISGYHGGASGTYGSFPGGGADPSVTAFTLTADDLNYLQNAGYKVYKMNTYVPADDTVSPAISEKKDVWNGSGTPSDYGVLAELTAGKSWHLYINGNAEFSDTNETNAIAMQAFAIDAVKTSGASSGKANISQAALRTMIFDANAPTITNPNIRAYTGTPASAAATDKSYDSTVEYKQEMYVKGETWISFTLRDDSAIGSLKIGLSDQDVDRAGQNKKDAALPTALNTNTVNADGDIMCYSPKTVTGVSGDQPLNKYVNVLAKLDTSGSVGTQYVWVEFKDTGSASAVEKYTINYDNKAPVLAPVTENGKDGYSINPSIEQSNGWYSFSSNVREDKVLATKQSGFKRVAFYFMRRDTTQSGTPTYIYDPMIKKGATGNKIDYSSDLVYSEGLYWKKIQVTRTAVENTVTLDALDDNAHPGGLAKIGGTIYTITAVKESEKQVVVDGQPEGTSGTKEYAYFAIGNVVDHTLDESPNGNDTEPTGWRYGYNAPSLDDGDYMPESVKQDDAKWIWKAYIYSKNIPDGPIELHYVAFDAAGNYAKGIAGCVAWETYKEYATQDAVDAKAASPKAPVSVYAYAQTEGSNIYKLGDVAAFVSNNAPRLANLRAGTDLDGDDNVSSAELSHYAYKDSYTDWASSKESLLLGSADKAKFTAKGKTVIQPEVIGGNGALYYSYKITSHNYNDGAAGESAKAGYIISGQNETAFMAAAAAREDQSASATADITLQVGDFINLPHDAGSKETGAGIADCGATEPALFEFTIWDSTQACAKFKSQKAKASVYMAVALRDSVAPEIDIEPVYWNSLTDNSTYQANKASTYAGLKGHLELPDDLPASFKASGATDTEMDKDPKLSGVIVLKGSVSDNKMLSKVFMSITNGTDGMDAVNGSFDKVKVAAADDTHCKDGATTPSAVKAYPLATYAAGTWNVAKNLASYGVEFAISDNEIGESGHTAKWTMVWDTSFVSNFAATDLKVRVFACDQTAESSIIPTSSTPVTYSLGVDGATKYTIRAFSDKMFSAGSDTTTSAEAKTPCYKVDVVPYITGLETTMTKKGAAYGRTSTGRYPVYFYKNSKTNAGSMDVTAGPSVTVKGFNLAANNASVTRTVGDTGANITASGELVMSVNGVKTLNNLNNDDAHGKYSKPVAKDDWAANTSATYNSWKNYTNRQPDKENNLLLTDDVYIDVWQLNASAAKPKTGIANDVTMKINPKSGMLNFAFVSGPLNSAMANYDATDASKINSYQTWATSNDFCKSVTLEVDGLGNTFGTGAGGDTGTTYADAFGLYSSKWGTGNTQTSQNSWQQAIESVGQKGTKSMSYDPSTKTYTNAADTSGVSGNVGYKTNQWRIVSPSLASTYTGTTTNIYLAYYDKMNDELRFREGKNVPASSTDGWEDFIDNFTRDDQEYTYAYNQIVAQSNSPTAKPGSYVCIAAHKFTSGDVIGDVVAMVWHDPVNSCMWYCYNTTPGTSRKGTINNQSGSGQGWSEPKTIFDDVSGEYCKVAFDKNGKVHIAAYDSSEDDLWYAYLDNYKDPEGATKGVVDSCGNTGSQITLDVAHSGSKPVPYIGYYAEGYSLPKVAVYLGDLTADTDIDGAKSDLFTGEWDVSMVPTVTVMPATPETYDKVSVGVWKSDGVLANSTKNDSKNYAGTAKGVCYGNGTSNPALAYKCDSGFVETAQKK